jgi:hypothetical protein
MSNTDFVFIGPHGRPNNGDFYWDSKQLQSQLWISTHKCVKKSSCTRAGPVHKPQTDATKVRPARPTLYWFLLVFFLRQLHSSPQLKSPFRLHQTSQQTSMLGLNPAQTHCMNHRSIFDRPTPDVVCLPLQVHHHLKHRCPLLLRHGVRGETDWIHESALTFRWLVPDIEFTALRFIDWLSIRRCGEVMPAAVVHIQAVLACA